jgi:hypothetical protein
MVGRASRRYSLGRVRALTEQGRYAVTSRVYRYMAAQSWDCSLVAECLCGLRTSDLHKSVPDPLRPGSHLDSYRPWCRGRRLYIKFTVDEDGDLYVLSFCRDGENH